MQAPVIYELRDGVATIAMNDGKANVMSVLMLQAINSALDRAETDTHYCAQGNQPRLVLQTTAQDHVFLFEFLDATNLRSVNDSHLVRMRFEVSGQQRFVRQEVYAENGKETESTLSLERAR